jgi:hypothetical protein
MLNSCASGVSVVNIDNGFGAAYQASLINKQGAERGGNQAPRRDTRDDVTNAAGAKDAKVSLVKAF